MRNLLISAFCLLFMTPAYAVTCFGKCTIHIESYVKKQTRARFFGVHQLPNKTEYVTIPASSEKVEIRLSVPDSVSTILQAIPYFENHCKSELEEYVHGTAAVDECNFTENREAKMLKSSSMKGSNLKVKGEECSNSEGFEVDDELISSTEEIAKKLSPQEQKRQLVLEEAEMKTRLANRKVLEILIRNETKIRFSKIGTCYVDFIKRGWSLDLCLLRGFQVVFCSEYQKCFAANDCFKAKEVRQSLSAIVHPNNGETILKQCQVK